MNTNSKLIILIVALKTMPGVLKLVRQVLQLTKKKRHLALLDFLVKHAAILGDIDKQKAIETVYPKRKINDSTYRTICSQLARLLEETMAGNELKAQPFMFKMYVARAYKKQGIDKQFFQMVKKGIEDDLPEKELQQYQALAESSSMIFFHPNANLHLRKEYQKYFDCWYINSSAVMALNGLKYYCIAMSRKLINGFEPIAGLEEHFPHFIQWIPAQVKELLIVRVFLKAATAIQTPTLKDYSELKKIFLDNLDELRSNHDVLLVHLINVLSFIDFNGNKKQEKFELYKIGVERNYFIEARIMASHAFSNIVYVACEAKETTWAEDFVASHFKYLRIETESLENVKRLSTCVVKFARGNLRRCFP